MSALLALAAGVPLGFLLRGRARAQLVAAASAPVLSALALVPQFLPGGAESCNSTAGVTTCESLPAASGWSLAAYVFAALMIVLSFAPLISVRIRNWIPSAVSAFLQLIPQAIHFGFPLLGTGPCRGGCDRVRSAGASPPGDGHDVWSSGSAMSVAFLILAAPSVLDSGRRVR
jgi:hypothetical protein